VSKSVVSVTEAFSEAAVPRFHRQNAALRPYPRVKGCFPFSDLPHASSYSITLVFSGLRLSLDASVKSEPSESPSVLALDLIPRYVHGYLGIIHGIDHDAMQYTEELK